MVRASGIDGYSSIIIVNIIIPVINYNPYGEWLTKLYFLSDNNPFYTDDWCVVMLLQGVCFKFLKRFEEAERCFQGIIDRLWNILNLLILAPGWLLSFLLKSRLFINTVFQGINTLLLGTSPSPHSAGHKRCNMIIMWFLQLRWSWGCSIFWWRRWMRQKGNWILPSECS